MLSLGKLFLSGSALFFFAVMPSTTNYELNDYGFGTGGGTGSTANYSLEGISGEQSGGLSSTATYSARPGLQQTQLANVPTATLSNPSNWYNKLLVVIGTENNPSDALYAIAISTDNFVTTNYVQNDATVGPSLGSEDYQTYAAWGSGSGTEIIGLIPNTTYKVKVKATNGEFTESGYGPEDAEATADLTLTFDIDIAPTDSESGSPYLLPIGDLLVNTVVSGSDKIWFDLETNAGSGGKIFLYSQNTGLYSTALVYTLTSVSADLTSSNEGVGVQSSSATQTSGGPLSAVSPYDGAGDVVGVTDTSVRQVYTTSSAVVGGRSSLTIKAKASQTTPAGNDYQDVLTIIAAANY